MIIITLIKNKCQREIRKKDRIMMMIVIMIIITLFYGIDNHYYADIDNNAH